MWMDLRSLDQYRLNPKPELRYPPAEIALDIAREIAWILHHVGKPWPHEVDLW